MLMKLCPKCRQMIPQSKQYCDTCQQAVAKHKAISKAKYDKRYNQTKRDPKAQEFYRSNEWKTLRAVKLARAGYVCEECKKNGVTSLAVDVHHIVPIKVDWDKRLDIDNLMCLCVKCHNKAHNRWGYVKKY